MEYVTQILTFIQSYVGVLVGVISITISIIFYFKQRKFTEMSYQSEITNLIDIKEEIKPDLKIYYKDDSIEKIHLFKIKIKNTGSVSIKSSDYEEEIRIRFDEDSQILDSNVVEYTPDNLSIIHKFDKNTITIMPLLLNKNDSLTIQALISKYNEFKIYARIVGVSSIKQYQGPRFIETVFTSLIRVTIVIGGFVVGIYIIDFYVSGLLYQIFVIILGTITAILYNPIMERLRPSTEL